MSDTATPLTGPQSGNSAVRSSDTHREPDHRPDMFASYDAAAPDRQPLGAYAALAGIYAVGLMSALQAVEKRDCAALTEISTRDFLLLALATHKLSRLITKDAVTSPFRAPFATYEGSTGAGEVSEKPRGTGMQRALGELFT